MARQRSLDRDKAFEIYKASNGEKPLVEIAKELNLKPSQKNIKRNLKSIDLSF
ncbi:phage terminase small subunit-related protein [Bacillus cereus]|uniref:phage terminase small subunit-related protein n=1 Tax=Bacillus cereus TaxID=1396 RepID=UPI0020D283CE|nr:phage terminase small subunit-related protein [Bacillus cereus]